MFLEESWHSGKTKEIAECLNRSVSAIYSRANNLKVVSGKWWTEAEIEYLKSNWSLQSALEISKTIQRSVSAIQIKANRMKLKGGFERASLAKRTGKFIHCANCGREFYKKSCLIKTRNFCCQKCLLIELSHIQSPNKSELTLDALLQANFPDEFAFNGDYSQGVTLGGLVPDWININGRKQVIELFGEYWHDGVKGLKWKATEFGRKSIFSQLGFDCLVIWSKELRHPEEVIVKIREFQGRSAYASSHKKGGGLDKR